MVGVAALALVAAWLPSIGATPAELETVVITSEKPGGFDFLIQDVVVDVDGTLTHLNAHLLAHNVISVDEHPTGDAPWCPQFTMAGRPCPLFYSALVGNGGTATVQGIDALEPLSSYDFVCQPHPWMTGTLHTI